MTLDIVYTLLADSRFAFFYFDIRLSVLVSSNLGAEIHRDIVQNN